MKNKLKLIILMVVLSLGTVVGMADAAQIRIKSIAFEKTEYIISGETVKTKLIATYNDNSTKDITDLAKYTISAPKGEVKLSDMTLKATFLNKSATTQIKVTVPEESDKEPSEPTEPNTPTDPTPDPAPVPTPTTPTPTPSPSTPSTDNNDTSVVKVDNFTGENDTEKIQNAIDFANKKGNPKTVVLSNRDYQLAKPIVIKQDVKLESEYGSRLIVNGNFRVFELQKNASLKGAYIAINSESFDSEVIYLYGAYNYYNSWWRSEIEDINIVNWTGKQKGTAIKLYTNGKSHEISFVKFENIKIAEMGTAINIESKKDANVPYYENGYISANNFNNIVIDNVLYGIIVDKASGNSFTNIQFQLESTTKEALRIVGSQYNYIEGMIWDGQRIPADASPLFTIDSKSSYNQLKLRGDIFPRFYSVKGEKNTY